MSEFSGLTAAVTGAGSGIGLETAKLLKERGATVYGLDLNEGDMAGTATFIKCDVGDDQSVAAAFQAIPTLDILVNNAAISSTGTVESNSSEEWALNFNINVIGMARTSRNALPLLRKKIGRAHV